MPERTGKHKVILIIGGTRSGKSGFALRLAEHRWPRPLYLATAEIGDAEMAQRVELHRQARGPRWLSVEEPLDVASVIRDPPSACDGILVDCVTIWASNALLKEGAEGLDKRRTELIGALQVPACGVILVTNEVGMGIVPESALGRQFRDLAGWINQDLAAAADTVVLVVAGLPLMLKGTLEP